jgi:hypothetical protein
MLQAALAEFKLEIRREMKEQNVYARWWEIAAASPMTAPSGREPRKGPIEMLIVTHLEDDDGN